jgi:hypothetical protein
MANSQWLWFLSRSSDIVLLMLFTAVMMLGTATRSCGSEHCYWMRDGGPDPGAWCCPVSRSVPAG